MNELLSDPLLPFAFPFMQQAFLITLAVAVPMGLISALLVLKGWSLMGDAISHAVLPGVVIAYVIALPLGAGAFVAGMGCALATGYLKENSRIKEDTVMGVVFSGMFGLGIVLYLSVTTDVHLDHILFGDMLGVTWGDLAESAAISAIATGFMLVFRKDLALAAFDEQHARAIGLPVRFLHYGLLAVVSLAVVAALKAVGIILAVAFLVAPGAIAFLLTRTFAAMMAAAAAIAAGASVLGIWASFFIDSAPAPTIVLIMTTAFIAAFIREQVRYARIQSRDG